MKALVFTAIRQVQLQDVPAPQIVQPHEALVRVCSSGICGSDLHGYAGISGRRKPPLIMGHEAAGVVAEVGSAVTRFRPGDRVVLQPWTYCGSCAVCLDGKHLWCSQRSLLGMNAPGAYAEYVLLPAVNLYPLPDAVPFEDAALTEPLAVALHAVGLANFRPHQAAVIIGAGTIGLLVLALLRSMGLRRLIVMDIDAGRLSLAGRLGADIVINPTPEDASAMVEAAVGEEGVEHVFEAVGVPDTFNRSIELTRRGGNAIWIGNNERYAEVDVQAIVTREITIRPSYGFTMREFGQAIELLASGQIPAGALISRRAGLEEGPELFDALLERSDIIKALFQIASH